MTDDYKQELRKELLRRELAKRKAEKPSWLERNANFAEENINKPIESLGRSARDIAGGFGQGLANIVPGMYNLGASGINALGGNVPKSPMINVVPHSPSATAGEVGSFFAGPGAAKALTSIPGIFRTGASAMKIPLIAEAVKHASNVIGKSPVASRIAGNAVLGGAYTPDNPLAGIGLGAAGGAGAELAGKGYSGIKNSLENNKFLNDIYAKINPAAHAKELEHELSGGANNITENSRLLNQDIRNAHNMRKEESEIFYNHALKNAGHEPIYGVGHKDIIPSLVPEYNRKQSTLSKIKGLKVGDLFNSFKSEPNFNNAHKLQSELGFKQRELEANPFKTPEDRVQIRKIESARTQLKDDINTFLEKRDINSNQPVGPHYQKGNELYQANVAPYLSDPKLLDIVRGGQTAVKNLHSVFDTPSNIMTKDGIEKIGSINKIMKDLPESSKQRIIFDAIGGNKLSPEALLKKLDEIKSKGFESYFTPELEESINALNKKIKNRNRLQVGTGIATIAGGGKTAYNAVRNLF